MIIITIYTTCHAQVVEIDTCMKEVMDSEAHALATPIATVTHLGTTDYENVMQTQLSQYHIKMNENVAYGQV